MKENWVSCRPSVLDSCSSLRTESAWLVWLLQQFLLYGLHTYLSSDGLRSPVPRPDAYQANPSPRFQVTGLSLVMWVGAVLLTILKLGKTQDNCLGFQTLTCWSGSRHRSRWAQHVHHQLPRQTKDYGCPTGCKRRHGACGKVLERISLLSYDCNGAVKLWQQGEDHWLAFVEGYIFSARKNFLVLHMFTLFITP